MSGGKGVGLLYSCVHSPVLGFPGPFQAAAGSRRRSLPKKRCRNGTRQDTNPIQAGGEYKGPGGDPIHHPSKLLPLPNSSPPRVAKSGTHKLQSLGPRPQNRNHPLALFRCVQASGPAPQLCYLHWEVAQRSPTRPPPRKPWSIRNNK